MPPKRKQKRGSKRRWELFKAIVANEDWEVVEALMDRLGPKTEIFIETTPSCRHLFEFEMLNVQESVLREYLGEDAGGCRESTRSSRRGAFSDPSHQMTSGASDLDTLDPAVSRRDSPLLVRSVASHPRTVTSEDLHLRCQTAAASTLGLRRLPSQQIGRVTGQEPSGRRSMVTDDRSRQTDTRSRLSCQRQRPRDLSSGRDVRQVRREGSVHVGGKTGLRRHAQNGSVVSLDDTQQSRPRGNTSETWNAKEKVQARKNTIRTLENLLCAGHCPCVGESRDHDVILAGVSPLNLASAFGHVQLVAGLLKYKTVGQALTRQLNWSPLHSVAGCNLGEDIALTVADELLHCLRGSVDIDTRDMHGMTALHVACKHGNHHMVKFLVQRLCAINLLSHFGTPLSVAVTHQDEYTINLLLSAGADTTMTNRFAPTPLMSAIQCHMVSAVHKILVQGEVDVNSMGHHTRDACKVKHRVSYLHVAVMEGDAPDNVRIAEMLLRRGANANALGQLATAPGHHFTPLILAAKLGYVNMAKVLLHHLCRVNAGTDRGETALHTAAAAGHYKVCCLLLASGANAEAETIYQETPLAMAARGNHCRVVRLMLSRKVDPERADCDLNTPAHLVAHKGCLTCMTSLLRSGASADTPNNLMTTPLWNAVYMGRVAMVERLLKTGVYPAVPSQGMELRPPGQTRAFIYGWPKTPLEVATEKNKADIIRALTSAGCSLPGESTQQKMLGSGRLWHYALSYARVEARKRLKRPQRKMAPNPDQLQRLLNDWLTAMEETQTPVASGSRRNSTS